MGEVIKRQRDGNFVGWYIRCYDADGTRRFRASKPSTVRFAARWFRPAPAVAWLVRPAPHLRVNLRRARRQRAGAQRHARPLVAGHELATCPPNVEGAGGGCREDEAVAHTLSAAPPGSHCATYRSGAPSARSSAAVKPCEIRGFARRQTSARPPDNMRSLGGIPCRVLPSCYAHSCS